MADEQNRPVEQNTEQPQVLHEQGTGKEVPVTPDYVAADPQTITDKQPPQNAVEASASGALEASEQAVNTPPVEGFDKAIDKLEHAMERGAEHAAEPHPIHVPSDTVTLPFINQTITVPGGIYSVVFGVLAILTIIEVLLSVIPEEGAATLVTGLITATLVLFSTIKAFLVAWFYMHLNHDNKLFRWILLVPVGLALVAAIYLLAVPSTGYTLSTP